MVLPIPIFLDSSDGLQANPAEIGGGWFPNKLITSFRICLGLQLMVALAHLVTPRPLISVACFLLVFLGWTSISSPLPARYFCYAFLSFVLGVLEIFWLVMKFTGPYGASWLEPQYYWKPLYPVVYEGGLYSPTMNAKHLERVEAAGGTKQSQVISPTAVNNFHFFPPEKPPHQWQIYVELVCFCVSPIVCLISGWVACRLYRRCLASTAEAEPFIGGVTADYGYGAELLNGSDSVIAAPSGVSTISTTERRNAGADQARGFVPFAGQGRRLCGSVS